MPKSLRHTIQEERQERTKEPERLRANYSGYDGRDFKYLLTYLRCSYYPFFFFTEIIGVGTLGK